MASARLIAKSNGETRYFGDVCTKHPELGGERMVSNFACVSCLNERKRSYKARNKDKVSAYNKAYSAENSDMVRAKQKLNKESRKHVISLARKEYRKKNRDAIRKYTRSKLAEDHKFLIATRLRNRTRAAFDGAGWTKHGKSAELLGADWGAIKKFIESKFVDGMGWHNRSQWHIDHIVPLASARTQEELCRLCHYTNLQPLWAGDNLSKGAKNETA